MFEEFLPYLQWNLGRWEVYGLFFLLGSFVVATLSDVKHMSAQREFMDVWWAFAALLFLLQLGLADWRFDGPFVLKWTLLLLLGALSHQAIGLWLRLATADVAAIVAAGSLFSPLLVLGFFLLLKFLAWPLGKLLARGRPAYPFMPVVTLATLVIVGIAFATGVVEH